MAHPTFRVGGGRGKMFCIAAHDGSSIRVKADPAERPALLAHGDPFYVPPYVGSKGWIGMNSTLDGFGRSGGTHRHRLLLGRAEATGAGCHCLDGTPLTTIGSGFSTATSQTRAGATRTGAAPRPVPAHGVRSGGRRELAALTQPVQQGVEIAAGEGAVERLSALAVFGLEAEDAAGRVVDVFDVAGRERLAGEDGEVDLDLVEPRRVRGQMHDPRSVR